MVPLPLQLHKNHISHLSVILILVNLELRSGDEVPVLLTNLQIMQREIFRLYQSMVKVNMVLFLIPTEPDSPEGYCSYRELFIPCLTGYLHNYIGCIPCQHGYIILEWLHLALLKLLQTPMQSHFVIQSYQILKYLKFVSLVLILGQTHAVPVKIHFLKNLLKVKLLQLRD